MEVLDPCDLSPFVCRSFFSPFIDESKDMESQWGGSGFALGDLAMQCFGGSYLFTGLYPSGQTLHISSLGVLALTRSIFQFPILSLATSRRNTCPPSTQGQESEPPEKERPGKATGWLTQALPGMASRHHLLVNAPECKTQKTFRGEDSRSTRERAHSPPPQGC